MMQIDQTITQEISAPRPLVALQVLPELESGGVEQCVLALAGYLARGKHTSLVVSGGGRLVPQLESEGSLHFSMPVGKKSPTSLAYVHILRRLLIDQKVDILHLHSRMPAWIAWLAWKSLPPVKRPRLVTTFHGFYSVNKYSAVMTKGEKIIAVSKAIQDHIQTQYQVEPGRIEMIYNGIDLEKFNPQSVSDERLANLARQWELNQDFPLILLPGRITRLKGHDIFLQSLKRIQDLPWTAVCAGDLQDNPEYAGKLQQKAKCLGLDTRVKFVGHCPDMPAAFKLADLVVSPASTEAEAFGLVAVEAAAMGKTVIASAHGGSLETVIPGKTGWLVEPNKEVPLANALREALSDDEYRHYLAKNGREWVTSNFSLAKSTSLTVELYQKLLSP